MIRFLLDGDIVELENCDPTSTVLEWLRKDRRRTGTKEGCAEGDCGACTVVVGELVGGKVRYRAVNACIFFLPMLDGKELVTVESIGSSADLHPVQKTLADAHGAQCGFCTPGIIMSLFARYQNSDEALTTKVDDVLAGNLCRCTGYGPIKKAAENCARSEPVQSRFGGDLTKQKLESIALTEMTHWTYIDPIMEHQRKAFRPICKQELLSTLAQNLDATMVSGATDVGLWVTKQNRLLETVVFLDAVDDLYFMEDSDSWLRIGAGVKYSDAWRALAKLHPDLGELVRRIGSVQVRNSGTIGGNIANGSPIGDTPPALIALGAELVLESVHGKRTLPLEAFFLEYGKQDLNADEIVSEVIVPKPSQESRFAAYKISKRFDQDISGLCGAFLVSQDGDTVTQARIAFGGMAGTPMRAKHTENALVGMRFSDELIETAVEALAHDYTPLSDMRASSRYRLKAAQNLLRKFFLEASPSMRTRILDGEPVSD